MQQDTHTQIESRMATAGSGVPQFVAAEELLEMLFPPGSRPSMRWLRERQKRREIPFIKIGRRVFFIASQVQESLVKKQTATLN